MKNIIKIILILIIFIIIFIILNFYISKKNGFEDIMIFSLWNGTNTSTEYELNIRDTVQIDVFNTIKNRLYKKIAPGSKGYFTIKFTRPKNSYYKINITEMTKKPKNLVFELNDKIYFSLEDMEKIINQEFLKTDQITINWEWKYYIDEKHDIQDTKEGELAEKYIFKIEAIVEDERTEI